MRYLDEEFQLGDRVRITAANVSGYVTEIRGQHDDNLLVIELDNGRMAEARRSECAALQVAVAFDHEQGMGLPASRIIRSRR